MRNLSKRRIKFTSREGGRDETKIERRRKAPSSNADGKKRRHLKHEYESGVRQKRRENIKPHADKKFNWTFVEKSANAFNDLFKPKVP